MKNRLATLFAPPALLLAPVLSLITPSFSASAVSLQVQVELPSLDVAEYHAPYVAMWLQASDKSVTNLALWYDLDMRNDEGLQWLKDIRQWWRRSGRTLSFPIDGVSGATRKAGNYTLNFEPLKAQLAALPAGDYEFFIEAAREVGGRELVSIPFTLPVSDSQQLSGQGSAELAKISLTISP